MKNIYKLYKERQRKTGLKFRKNGEARNAGNWISSLSRAERDSRARDIALRARSTLHLLLGIEDKSTDKTRISAPESIVAPGGLFYDRKWAI